MYPTLVTLKESVHQNLLPTQQEDSHSQKWRPSPSEVAKEIKQLYAIAFPMVITGLLIYGKSAISMLFMGRLGKIALAGGSLSTGIANITGFSLISGLSMGMDAIASQAHGAHQFLLMTQTLHRTIAILLSVSIPISLLWFHINPLLLAAGQDPAISEAASTYLLFSIPSLLFQSFTNPLKIYLRVQNLTSPLIAAATVSLSLHFPINYLLVYRFDLGIRGIALASSITDLTLLATLLLYLSFSKSSQTINSNLSFSSFFNCFFQWRPILTLAIPSCISVCLEWWWYELMIILSGLLPNPAESVSAMGILLQATSLVYIFPWALSLAVSTRVGNELGANRPEKARTSAHVAFCCAIFTSFIATSFLVILRNEWGRAFTADEAILTLTAAAMPVVGLCELGNCPQTTGCGVLRGSARPGLGVKIYLGSFYGVGLPLAELIGFVIGMGVMGLWLGLMGAQVACCILMVFVAVRTDWEEEANKAQLLIGIIVDRETEDDKDLLESPSFKLVN